ncbi:NAD(P)H-dependent glycerol-3-phosphate dehydrogenase [Pleionea sediminis]|uniref:NAD(P)H-dependent glycerol-3-phosphate dehydrogenase n=1 Tax=Pleionea sediminis TaxID=2569479 RepID=UPI00118720F1|nr:NAD(P)H-dependent glycerol-3-phosphate dehydrogenase [Pleionea sediminis]
MTTAPEQFSPIAVLGAGSFGTALAILLAGNGNPTRLWCRDPDQAKHMQNENCNTKYLPEAPFPSTLEVSDNLEQTLKGVRDVLVVTPSGAFSETLKKIKPLVPKDVRIVWACKGLEPGSARFLHEIALEIFGDKTPIAVLSGPTFAKELATAMPTAITLASNDEAFSEELAERLVNNTFRVYTSCDLVGVQIGGALKNVIAVGAGIADGMGFGSNARTALITRGLAEIQRLGLKLGGRPETFQGLAGLGDLLLTCTDNQSRNRRFGLAVGSGEPVESAIEKIGQVVEGAKNAHQAVLLAEKNNVDMPISNAIYRIVHEGADPEEQAYLLLGRQMKSEGE